MSDRFRDLEKPSESRRLELVLMATISGLEDLSQPTRQDLKQFAELFIPLFENAGEHTQRLAAAALSKSRHLPARVARLVARQPIAVSAPFLANSPAVAQADLMWALASHGVEQARAIARRRDLCPQIVRALLKFEDPVVMRSLVVRGFLDLPAAPTPPEAELQRRADNEEDTRQRLKALVRMQEQRPDIDEQTSPNPPSSLPEGAEDRLRRHIADGEPDYFATALADALSSSFALAERIMLDVSGQQLAETLVALGFPRRDAKSALEAFFPHLSGGQAGMPRAGQVLDAIDPEQAAKRIEAWKRADSFTGDDASDDVSHTDGEALMAKTANSSWQTLASLLRRA